MHARKDDEIYDKSRAVGHIVHAHRRRISELLGATRDAAGEFRTFGELASQAEARNSGRLVAGTCTQLSAPGVGR